MTSLDQLLVEVCGSEWAQWHAIFICKQGQRKTTLLINDVARAIRLSSEMVPTVTSLLKNFDVLDFVSYPVGDDGTFIAIWKRVAIVMLAIRLSCKVIDVPAKTSEVLRKAKLTRSKFDYSIHSNCIRIIFMRLEWIPSYCYHCKDRDKKTRLCSGCRSVHYCGTPCQTAGWGTHRMHCEIFGATTKALRNIMVPIDDETRVKELIVSIKRLHVVMAPPPDGSA